MLVAHLPHAGVDPALAERVEGLAAETPEPRRQQTRAVLGDHPELLNITS